MLFAILKNTVLNASLLCKYRYTYIFISQIQEYFYVLFICLWISRIPLSSSVFIRVDRHL